MRDKYPSIYQDTLFHNNIYLHINMSFRAFHQYINKQNVKIVTNDLINNILKITNIEKSISISINNDNVPKIAHFSINFIDNKKRY